MLSPRGLEMINSWGGGGGGGGGGGMVIASMYPASRIVVKPIKYEYTSALKDFKNAPPAQMLIYVENWIFSLCET